MDVWRYSDWAGWTDGKQIRDSQPHIWRWRDWIVESLNADRGYDQMVADMLAADELHRAIPAPCGRTGYLARNYKMLSRETWLQDTVLHTAQAFLGVTLAVPAATTTCTTWSNRTSTTVSGPSSSRTTCGSTVSQVSPTRGKTAWPGSSTPIRLRSRTCSSGATTQARQGPPATTRRARIFGAIDFKVETGDRCRRRPITQAWRRTCSKRRSPLPKRKRPRPKRRSTGPRRALAQAQQSGAGR